MTMENQAPRRSYLPAVALLFLLAWTYLPVFARLVTTWSTDSDYSHGYFVIPIAALLLWNRRDAMPASSGPSLAGLLLLGAGLGAWLTGVIVNIPPVEQFSLLPTLAGVVWVLCGTGRLRWALPAIAYLVFMIPLPYSLAIARAGQLQHVAASSAAYLLQAFGIPALATGNLIELEKETLDVAYACSGLQMMIAFLAVTTAIAMMSNFYWLGKVVLVLSAIPIAIVCNILRITITAIAYQYFSGDAVRLFFHDLGGLIFIPIAIALALLEIYLFEHSFPVVRTDG